MRKYIQIHTKEYPVTEEQIRERYLKVDFGDMKNPPSEYALVNEMEKPLGAVREGPPVCIQGNWIQTWEFQFDMPIVDCEPLPSLTDDELGPPQIDIEKPILIVKPTGKIARRHEKGAK